MILTMNLQSLQKKKKNCMSFMIKMVHIMVKEMKLNSRQELLNQVFVIIQMHKYL